MTLPYAVFCNCDYKQLEVRVGAWLSKDPNLIEACKGDIHTVVNNKVFKIQLEQVKNCSNPQQIQQVAREHIILNAAWDYYQRNREKYPFIADLIKFCIKFLRDECKKITFGVMYGREAFSLSQVLKCTEREARQYIDLFFQEYALLKAYLDQQKQYALDEGWLETPFGNRRRFPYMTPEFEARTLKQTTNFGIQATANGINVRSFIKLAPVLRQLGYGSVKFLVHDAMALSLKLETIRPALALIKDRMENTVIPEDTGGLRFEIDQSIGSSYGDMHEPEAYLKEIGYGS